MVAKISGVTFPPAADSADNNTTADVIGNKTDSHSGDSLYAKAETMGDHVHSESKVYPTLAAGVTVASSGTAFTLGNFVEIVPVSTITSDFDVHYISIEDLSANGVYELVLYAVEVEIGRVRFTKNAVQDGTVNAPFQSPICSANAQIQAKLSTDNAAGDAAVISLFYHTY